MNNLINDLHLVTGKIGSSRRHGPFSLTGQPSACGTAREVGTLANRLPADMLVMKPEHRKKTEEIWGLAPGTTIPQARLPYGRHVPRLHPRRRQGDVGPDHQPVGLVARTCTASSASPTTAVRRRQRDLPHADVPSMADLILPVGRRGSSARALFGNSERRTQQWNQLVDPPGEAKEDAWQIVEVAKRMGMGNLFPLAG